jgi:hypothetical protein
MVIFKNFATGFQWVYSKEKFLDRKEEISQFYSDINDNGVINQEKYKVWFYNIRDIAKNIIIF